MTTGDVINQALRKNPLRSPRFFFHKLTFYFNYHPNPKAETRHLNGIWVPKKINTDWWLTTVGFLKSTSNTIYEILCASESKLTSELYKIRSWWFKWIYPNLNILAVGLIEILGFQYNVTEQYDWLRGIACQLLVLHLNFHIQI